MTKTAGAVIVGGGVVGCSIAYHLAKLGCQDVVILEKDSIGSGSTSKCPGGIRQQFSTEVNIKLSMGSVKFFERFEEETGYPADFCQYGYLILATTADELELSRQNVALQRKLGLEVYLLSAQEVKERVPELNVEDIVGATYCPTDGYADPYSVVQGFASAAKRLGVKIYEETQVIGIEVAGSQVRGVLTTRKGQIQAPIVVDAAGPYAAQIGKMVGLDIPIRTSRRHVFVTAPLNTISKSSPMVIDFHTGFWFRREGPGLIFGMRNPNEPESFDTSVDWGWLPVLGEVASQRLPMLSNIGIMRAQSGLHVDTPDSCAIIGDVPGVEGLYLACGFSGHGFMHSPAVGKYLAELILKGEEFSLDVSGLLLQRFKREINTAEELFI